MKKIFPAVVASLLLLPAVVSFAQKEKHKHKEKGNTELPPPRVWIANIPSYTTTREMLLTNQTLITDSPGCVVSGFTLSLMAPGGHDFFGPLYAHGNEFSQVQKDKLKEWDFPNVTVYIQDIHLNCHNSDATSPALTYKYNVK